MVAALRGVGLLGEGPAVRGKGEWGWGREAARGIPGGPPGCRGGPLLSYSGTKGTCPQVLERRRLNAHCASGVICIKGHFCKVVYHGRCCRLQVRTITHALVTYLSSAARTRSHKRFLWSDSQGYLFRSKVLSSSTVTQFNACICYIFFFSCPKEDSTITVIHLYNRSDSQGQKVSS